MHPKMCGLSRMTRQVPGSRLDWLSYGDELGKAVLRTNVVLCNMLPTACSANAQPLPLAQDHQGPRSGLPRASQPALGALETWCLSSMFSRCHLRTIMSQPVLDRL